MKVIIIAFICWMSFVPIKPSAITKGSRKSTTQLIPSDNSLGNSERCEKRAVAATVTLILAIGPLVSTLWSIVPKEQSVDIQITSAVTLQNPVWYMDYGRVLKFPPPAIGDKAPAEIRFDAKPGHLPGSSGALAYAFDAKWSLVVTWDIPMVKENKYSAKMVKQLFPATDDTLKTHFDTTKPDKTTKDKQEYTKIKGTEETAKITVSAAMGSRAQATLIVNVMQAE